MQIPEKLYFKIGEVAHLIGVEPSVLRYWETEFPQISPVKSKTNQRMYKHRDVEALIAIRGLLYDQKFTIDGAKRKMKELRRETRESGEECRQALLDLGPSTGLIDLKKKVRNEIESLVSEMDEFLQGLVCWPPHPYSKRGF